MADREQARIIHKNRRAIVKQRVAEGYLNPDNDPEYITRLNEANAEQTMDRDSPNDNPWETLQTSPDQDPHVSTQRVPRTVKGRGVNQPVVVQGALPINGQSAETRVMSVSSRQRLLKPLQPIERQKARSRKGIADEADDIKAQRQRFAIRESMEKRGGDV